MARPTKPYSRRTVDSYERDKEYLLRLRSAIWLDSDLDSDMVGNTVKVIDLLLVALRDLAPAPRARLQVGSAVDDPGKYPTGYK